MVHPIQSLNWGILLKTFSVYKVGLFIWQVLSCKVLINKPESILSIQLLKEQIAIQDRYTVIQGFHQFNRYYYYVAVESTHRA